MSQPAPPSTTKTRITISCLALITFLVYYFSNLKPSYFYDYTFRIAEAILNGRLGLATAPPSWLNEMVPLGDRYYSVFPLGSVLTMLPLALLKAAGVIKVFPAGFVAGITAAATATFLFLLSSKHGDALERRLLLSLFPLFGTWMWCNLAFAGAWQIALGFAVLGQAGALYFTLLNPQPLVAGFFFALAFGNRTEVILTAPIFVYLIMRDASPQAPSTPGGRANPRSDHRKVERTSSRTASWRGSLIRLAARVRERRRNVALFMFFPFVLGLLTLAYNYARFSSPFDFGYARIPGVLQESWYKHGIFSIHAIPLNVEKMLFEGWKTLEAYPYFVPTGFGGSIFLSSPFMFLLFRRRARDRGLYICAWSAVALLTLLLWCHGNPGGWQFSYRYAMILLPWMFLILLENGKKGVSAAEAILFFLSVAINAFAVYLFLWTNYVKP